MLNNLLYRIKRFFLEISIESSYLSFKEVWDEWKNGDALARSMTPSLVEFLNNSQVGIKSLIKLLQEKKKVVRPDSPELKEIEGKILDLNDKLSLLDKADGKINNYLFNQAEVKFFE